MNIKMDFKNKLDQHTKNLPNQNYIIEITKCCEYGEFVIIDKNATLLELYDKVSKQFECRDIKSLYITQQLPAVPNVPNVKICLPMTSLIKLKEFIATNHELMRPIYGMPSPVVYKIYLDDGHMHTH